MRGRLLDACRGALGGELRVTLEEGTGPVAAVMTTRALLAAWDPALFALPTEAKGDWSREIALGDARTSFFRAIKTLLLQAAEDGLLELIQAASIANAVSLALDGAGPFSRAPAGQS